MPVVGGAAPDDERAEHGLRYVGTGLLSLLLIAVAVALFFLPPAFAAGFILRGRTVLRAVGYALGAVWFLTVVLIGRRIMAPPRSGTGP